jgi:dTDP-4-dehydrorhamnose 3,5-epimerase
MKCIPTALPGVYVLEPKLYRDQRGYFFETFNLRELERLALHRTWVQDNQSHSIRHVLRGLHYQLGRPQAKLVRAVQGEIFDVAVDVRRDSPTFGRWVGVTLSGNNHQMLFIPEGFAHGFYVLSETAKVIYKCSDFYAPQEERGLLWSDRDLAVHWPIPAGATPLLSGKDSDCPTLAQIAEGSLPRYHEAAA